MFRVALKDFTENRLHLVLASRQATDARVEAKHHPSGASEDRSIVVRVVCRGTEVVYVA